MNKEKDNNKIKKEIVLEKEQQDIFDDVIINKNDKRVISITGAAGTGKSTTAGEIIKELYNTGNSLCITAPTHQALKVIKNMVQKALDVDLDFCNDLYFKTVHGFLGLKLQIDDDGKEIYRTCNNPDERMIISDYLFVDESSMVDEELSKLLFEAASKEDRIRKQIIFIGDRYQLKPVSGKENLIFTSSSSMVHRYELKEVRRQNKDSEIIKLSQYLVKLIEDNDQYNKEIFFHEILKPRKDIEIFEESEPFMKKYFEKENDKIIGCYTNNLVQQYNEYIRYINNKDEYPQGVPLFLEGEEVIFLQPYQHNNALLFNNGDIVKIDKISYKNNIDHTLYYFYCTTEKNESFKILDPGYQGVLKQQLDSLAMLAKNSSGRERSRMWKNFFDLKNRYARVRPVYANTFHKLQGSTYNDVFINVNEFMKYITHDIDNILRLVYVAFTRGKKLYLLK